MEGYRDIEGWEGLISGDGGTVLIEIDYYIHDNGV